jgi:hypothetical protein
MDIVKLVAEKAGIGEAQAQIAVSVITGMLKDKLPAPIAGQIDSLLGGGSQSEGDGGLMDKAGDMLGSVKGMFGG